MEIMEIMEQSRERRWTSQNNTILTNAAFTETHTYTNRNQEMTAERKRWRQNSCIATNSPGDYTRKCKKSGQNQKGGDSLRGGKPQIDQKLKQSKSRKRGKTERERTVTTITVQMGSNEVPIRSIDAPILTPNERF